MPPEPTDCRTSSQSRVPDDAPLTRPHFSRRSIQDARYSVPDEAEIIARRPEPAFDAVARYEVDGVPVEDPARR